MEAPVKIEPYNPTWPAAFSAERTLLASALGPWLAGPIEHVGSTAVPGLPAKPVIDIMAAVKNLESSRPALERLRELGYRYAPYRCDVMHWLCKPSPELRTHHLHLVPFQSALWIERLAFRDLLAADPVLANEYAALKYRLAEVHRHERERYTEAKGPFIEKALRENGARMIGYGPWVTFACYTIVAALFLWGSVGRWSLIGPFLIAGGLVVLGILEVISASVRTAQKAVLVGVAVTGIASMLSGIYMTWMR